MRNESEYKVSLPTQALSTSWSKRFFSKCCDPPSVFHFALQYLIMGLLLDIY